MENDKRIRMFEIVQYDEYWNPSTALAWLQKIACDFLAVKHDKDIKEDGSPKPLHYHIAVRLKDARTLTDIAKNCDIDKQYIEFVHKFKDKCAYLFHLTSNARKDQKYEYDSSAVIGSKHITYEEVKARSIDYDNKAIHDAVIKQALIDYGDCKITKHEVLSKMTAEDYGKQATLFKRMQDYRILKVKERDMIVAYITGEAGAGKTTLAKFLARTKRYDYFVSGSGKDVLDGYDKEECIILDDLRADAFTKAELFKLTDNNTNSSVKSRFRNKDISYCKLLIITSIFAPHDLYEWKKDNPDDIPWERNEVEDELNAEKEPFEQFARRINHKFLYCKRNGTIYEYTYDLDGKVGSPKVMPWDMDDIFSILGIEKRLGSNLMDEIYDKVAELAEEDRKKKKSTDDLPF